MSKTTLARRTMDALRSQGEALAQAREGAETAARESAFRQSQECGTSFTNYIASDQATPDEQAAWQAFSEEGNPLYQEPLDMPSGTGGRGVVRDSKGVYHYLSEEAAKSLIGATEIAVKTGEGTYRHRDRLDPAQPSRMLSEMTRQIAQSKLEQAQSQVRDPKSGRYSAAFIEKAKRLHGC